MFEDAYSENKDSFGKQWGEEASGSGASKWEAPAALQKHSSQRYKALSTSGKWGREDRQISFVSINSSLAKTNHFLIIKVSPISF